jgi:hypothetical protein
MSVLLRGAKERIEIPCPDQKTMRNIQMRLQMLRGAMFREKHPQYNVVVKARTSRTWDKTGENNNCVLVIQPNDAQFSDILSRAGITATDNEKDILADINVLPPSEPERHTPHLVEPNPYDKWKKLV